MKKYVLAGSIVSLLFAATAEAKGVPMHRKPRPEPTQQQLLDARFIEAQIQRCITGTNEVVDIIRNGAGGDYGPMFDDREIRLRCIAIVGSRR